ncbi:O-methyltransferase [Vogesella sp. XCS3]|uniref:O-methyltransferase n=1 Tax=Vogesella sp. XCS3 TaxID=2877939 RepID=UPI001D0A0EF9|nr:O-methyltransferase [Vogesella sp. XCS3]UDM16066.1 hypothetical protein LCH97_12270 [Vogesella sp. XCS3]
MSNSGRKINYSIRPAKNIERKMMRDMFLRLREFNRLEDYSYVGFGSKYFTDFIVFHKILNISKMISIESDVNNRKRYEFNKPYSCITMQWGKSTEVIPKIISENKKSIYWLDYDDVFQSYMLSDAAILSEQLESGSFFCASFNCEPFVPQDASEDEIRNKLVDMVGKDYVGSSIETRGWQKSTRIAVFLKNCLKQKIEHVLKNRNLSLGDNEKLQISQELFFIYADGANMATVGFFFYTKEDENKYQNCGFSDFYFNKNGDEPFLIKTPNFTIKEIRHLMEKRPDLSGINYQVFTQKDVEELWENYRYFPGFSEVESF